MANRPKPKFEIGDRVRVPVLLLRDAMRTRDHTTMCLGSIESRRWEPGDGGRPDAWYYGVALDIGGGTLAREDRTERLDVVTELGDLA